LGNRHIPPPLIGESSAEFKGEVPYGAIKAHHRGIGILPEYSGHDEKDDEKKHTTLHIHFSSILSNQHFNSVSRRGQAD
jgi:hypothetical protein